ncbi:MAG: 2-oxo acid dehydrogenase subunit E2, partial [Eubacterium sp.]|nr:2-oxo acid dehydrogenase subunit E2 [Eubacterium sp.]
FSLTIDHGFTDGVYVAKFLTSVNKVLQDPWTYMYHKAEPKTDEVETAE